MSATAKLILIRGPSGSGKSTIARAVVDTAFRPTALVERDHYMLMFNEAGRYTIDQALIELVILGCLDRGFDVVFEGNFKLETHRDLLTRLFTAHPQENYIFYIDVSLDESLRRHATRDGVISEEEMRDLHPVSAPMGDPREVLIPETTSAEDAVQVVMATAGLRPTPC